MTEDSDKVPPERLELRARPRPIRRLNKRTLMIGCAVAALFIAGATIVALSPPRIFKPGERTELYNTDRKQTADGLSKLPKSYENLPPKLGPPSPGDVGRAFAESEKKLGAGPTSETPFQANAEQDVERAERIRQTRIAQQAKEFEPLISAVRQAGPPQTVDACGVNDRAALGVSPCDRGQCSDDI